MGLFSNHEVKAGGRMNYIQEINVFERWLETNYLPSSSQLLWYKLIMLCNRCGWAEWVTVDNRKLMGLIEAGMIEFQKGKKGSPNRYKLISLNKCTAKNEVQTEVKNDCTLKSEEVVVENPVENICTSNFAVQTEVYTEVEAEVYTEVETEVYVNDINKLNKTKLNKKDRDMLNSISPPDYRQRYSEEQLKTIDCFFDVLKHTRKSAKMSDTVILGIYKSWDRHDTEKVLYALNKYIQTPSMHDKNEKYVLGIINNTTMVEVERHKNGQVSGNKIINRPQAKPNRFANFPQRKWDFDKLEKVAREELNRDSSKSEVY